MPKSASTADGESGPRGAGLGYSPEINPQMRLGTQVCAQKAPTPMRAPRRGREGGTCRGRTQVDGAGRGSYSPTRARAAAPERGEQRRQAGGAPPQKQPPVRPQVGGGPDSHGPRVRARARGGI